MTEFIKCRMCGWEDDPEKVIQPCDNCRSTAWDPLNKPDFPECMKPFGTPPCAGYQALQARVAGLEAERDAIKAEAIRRGEFMAFPGGVDPLSIA